MQNPVMERLNCFQVSSGVKQPLIRFSRKEQDEETGFYYFGARYLDPKTSVWISADPAMGDYVPRAPIDDEAKRHNENLPGMGGVNI
jgi:RHS repeat-associated protein